MVQLDETLEQNGFQHQLLISGNIHGWASAPDFETGLLWMQVNAMKEHRQPQNDTLIRALKKDMDRRIAAETSSGDWINAYKLSSGAAKVLDGLTDVSAYKKQAAAVSAGASYKNAIALQAQLQQEEIKGQQELERQFAVQNEKWWADKIAELNGNVKAAKTLQQSQMNKRLVNYLGFVGYMYTDHALKAGDFVNAETYLKIFKLADPKNPDCSYLAAVYYMGKGNSAQALSSLNQAASSGYSEASKLITDPAFEGLHGDAGFKRIVSRVRDNVRNK